MSRLATMLSGTSIRFVRPLAFPPTRYVRAEERAIGRSRNGDFVAADDASSGSAEAKAGEHNHDASEELDFDRLMAEYGEL